MEINPKAQKLPEKSWEGEEVHDSYCVPSVWRRKLLKGGQGQLCHYIIWGWDSVSSSIID